MGKDLNINNFDDALRVRLEKIQKERNFSTLTGMLKVVLKEYADAWEKKDVDKKCGFSDNGQ